MFKPSTKEKSNDSKKHVKHAFSEHCSSISRVVLKSGNPNTAAARSTDNRRRDLDSSVTGARNAKGKIRVALFRGAQGFPDDASQAIHTQAADVDPQTSSAQVVIPGLPDGVYAVSVFHDENMNERLDKNFMGVPKEGYGASNNPKKKMGPPNFDEANFQLSGTEQAVEIKLMY